MFLVTIVYLAAVVTFKRDFEVVLACRDNSFEYNVTVTVPLASANVKVDLVCLNFWNTKERKVQVLDVNRWFSYEIGKAIANLLLVIGITGIRWFKVVKKYNLLLISMLSFILPMILDIILIVNWNLLFSIEAFKIDNMTFGNKSIILKIIEYIWLVCAFILLNVNVPVK